MSVATVKKAGMAVMRAHKLNTVSHSRKTYITLFDNK